jgi:hypothetical protein
MSSAKSYTIDQPVRQFVSTQQFNNDFFSYTTTQNPNTGVITGDLSANVATYAQAPPGRILRDGGLKLYPGVNPNVNTYMIGVIDTVTLLAGYIDPNSPIYAVYSTKLPGFYANGVDPGPQGLSDEGPPVYTNGIVYALQSVSTAGDISAGTTIYAGDSITANTFIVADTTGSAGSTVSAGTTMYTGTGVVSATGQNRVNLLTTTTVSIRDTSGTTNFGQSQVYKFDFALDGSGAYTINAVTPTGSPAAVGIPGAVIYLDLNNTAGTPGRTVTIVFGARMREANVNGNITLYNSQRASVTFVSDGNSFFEVCRRAITV